MMMIMMVSLTKMKLIVGLIHMIIHRVQKIQMVIFVTNYKAMVIMRMMKEWLGGVSHFASYYCYFY